MLYNSLVLDEKVQVSETKHWADLRQSQRISYAYGTLTNGDKNFKSSHQKLTSIITVALNKGASGYVHTGTISCRYRTGLIFGTEKLTVHTGPVRYRTVLRPFHTGTLSYRSTEFRAKTSKRKSDMSTNFKHCRIRSNFSLKFKKH